MKLIRTSRSIRSARAVIIKYTTATLNSRTATFTAQMTPCSDFCQASSHNGKTKTHEKFSWTPHQGRVCCRRRGTYCEHLQKARAATLSERRRSERKRCRRKVDVPRCADDLGVLERARFGHTIKPREHFQSTREAALYEWRSGMHSEVECCHRKMDIPSAQKSRCRRSCI